MMMWFCLLISMRPQAAGVRFRAKVSRTKLLKGEECQISFANTKRITYKFKSSNKKVFTVSKKQGLIRAKGKGSATLTITGTWKKGSRKQTWVRQVRITVSSCKLSKSKITMKQGKSKKLSIRGLKLKRKISWYSQTPQICSVSSNGQVSALRKGTGYVCAQVGNYVTLRCKVTVTVTELKGTSFTLLVNPTHTYGSVDLAAEMKKAAGADKAVSLTLNSQTVGHLEGDIYYADQYGTNTVTAYCGGYEKVFTIVQKVWSAHRGYSDMYPENTIDAFEGAAFAGAAFIETDIRLTKDRELVCMHDEVLANMTNSATDATVYSMTLEEIRQLQINNGNNLSLLVHRQVPTFAEYLQVCRRYGIIAVIEMKNLGTNANMRVEVSRKILNTIETAGMKDRCIIISPSAPLLKAFRNATGEDAYSIPIAATTDTVWRNAQQYNLTNIYSSYKVTPFGTCTSSDYSPLVGRKNKVLDTYHNRVPY